MLAEEEKEPGVYEILWDGADAGGRRSASGIYFIRLQGGDGGDVRKILLTR